MFQKTLNKIRLKSTFVSLFLILMIPVSTIAAPVIFYTDITSGPNTGGENNNGIYLSIFGKGFGTTRGTSKVYINNVEVASYKVWSDTMVSIQPGVSVSTGAIRVNVNGENSNTDHTFTVRPGKIYFLANDNPENGPAGNDATGVVGDITKPFRNVQDTYQSAGFAAGDFIVMRGGNWVDYGSGPRFVKLVISKNGTASTPITFMGYPGENVVIDLSQEGEKKAFGSYLNGGEVLNYFNIVDIDLSKGLGTSCCVMTEAGGGTWEYFRVVNMDVTGGACGAGMSNSIFGVGMNNYSKYLGVRVHDTDPNCEANKHHLFYLHDKAHDIEVGWSGFYNQSPISGSYAFQLNDDDERTGNETLYNITVHDSLFYNTRRGVVISRGSGRGIKFYNNIFYNTATDTSINDGGIHINNVIAEVEIYNNTFYGQGSNAMAITFEDAASVLVKNNIIMTATPTENYYNVSTGFDTNKITAANNIWYGSSQAVPSWDINAINKDPLFVDPTAPARNFYLQLDSPAIDAGISTSVARDMDGTLRPQGGAHDIGAYEYCSSNCPVADAMPPTKVRNLAVK